MKQSGSENFGTGRIEDIVREVEEAAQRPIKQVDWKVKLQALCIAMQVDVQTLDETIAMNSPVLRTVKGHAFETYFDHLLNANGIKTTEIGGDGSIDRVVNEHTLQLKTPTSSGTSGDLVQFKTHKTHGAKSEKESMDYYHQADHFPDFLVGLVSYEPLRILILHKSELPRHRLSEEHIKSPFTVRWQEHPALNAFDRLDISVSLDNPFASHAQHPDLVHTARATGVPPEIIVDTIMSKPNFRIWDMSIRGFIRESVFRTYADKIGIELDNPAVTGRQRFDKADFVLSKNNHHVFLQMKGVSTNNCDFNQNDPIIATETQLTRGRVNDHPTQSRLYLESDFDYLILGLDPPISKMCDHSDHLSWKFFAVPTTRLERHASMPHRLKSLQKFRYSELSEFDLQDIRQLS